MEDVEMVNYDLTPLWRSTVGFDHLFDLLEDSGRWPDDNNYPPYNIERTGENSYRISLALAGFQPNEITVTAEQNTLTIEGRKTEKEDKNFIYQGISGRPFRRAFNLAEYVEVKGASFDAGLLRVDLVRELPEKMKPRQIAIQSGGAKERAQIVDHKAA
jgi:molecular chaperone IbpA